MPILVPFEPLTIAHAGLDDFCVSLGVCSVRHIVHHRELVLKFLGDKWFHGSNIIRLRFIPQRRTVARACVLAARERGLWMNAGYITASTKIYVYSFDWR